MKNLNVLFNKVVDHGKGTRPSPSQGYYLYALINRLLRDDGLELHDIQVKEINNLVKDNPYIQMVWVA
jgi:hypothetical protein